MKNLHDYSCERKKFIRNFNISKVFCSIVQFVLYNYQSVTKVNAFPQNLIPEHTKVFKIKPSLHQHTTFIFSTLKHLTSRGFVKFVPADQVLTVIGMQKLCFHISTKILAIPRKNKKKHAMTPFYI